MYDDLPKLLSEAGSQACKNDGTPKLPEDYFIMGCNSSLPLMTQTKKPLTIVLLGPPGSGKGT